MSVSGRYILRAALVTGGLLLGAPALGDPPSASGSGCCTRGGAPAVSTPDVRVATPSVHVSNPGLVGGGHTVSTGIAQRSGGYAVGVGGGHKTVIIAGGAGACCDAPGLPQSSANLRVVGEVVETISEQVPVTIEEHETRTRTVRTDAVVRAMCIDESGTPHPASQTNGHEVVDAHFTGEIFRCMAGTSMQVTIGHVEQGAADFQGGQTMMCAPGEALRHTAGGRLTCATQEARRECNERSLLRKFGPGVKRVTVLREETYTVAVPRTHMQTVNREVVRHEERAAPIVFDGGVGAFGCIGC